MVLKFFCLAITLLLISCTDFQRDNPDDPDGVNYQGNQLSSSKPSSSSVAPIVPNSSSSLTPSSSSSSIPYQIVYGDSVFYEGETYATVVIGSQTWFKRNLNYAAPGSKCGDGNNLSDTNTETCDIYGRLYKWATAIALPDSCGYRGISCSSQINEKHRGICPSGWHIPSDADWSALRTAVGGGGGWGWGGVAGKYLKATSGWNNDGNGEDKYGFTALPGGFGGYNGSGSLVFGDVGNWGFWWSSEKSGVYWNMSYNSTDVSSGDGAKSGYNATYMNKNYLAVLYYARNENLFSVRCLKD